jgi:hypothetical protein
MYLCDLGFTVCITDAPLMKFLPKLADFYSKKPEVPESAWPPIKKTHYVNLALIKPQAMNFGKDYIRQTIHGSIDDIFKDKEKISYEDAFNKHDNGSRILPSCINLVKTGERVKY